MSDISAKRLLFIYYYCNVGGVSSVIKQRMPALSRNGYQVSTLFQSDSGGQPDLLASGIISVEIAGSEFLKRAELLGKSGDFDIVVVFDVPEVVPLLAGSSAAIVYEVHTPIRTMLERNTSATLRAADLVVVPSEWSRSWILTNHPDVQDDHVACCPNIVDDLTFFESPDPIGDERSVEVVWVGKLSDYKCWEDAVRVTGRLLRANPSCRATLITGSQALPAVVEDFVGQLLVDCPVQRVRWLHNVPHTELGAVYRRAAASGGMLISVSEAESFCLVAHEAMRCGLPVVATHVGALPEVVHHGESGLLVELGDVLGLVAAAEALVSDAELRSRLVTGARRALEPFSRATAESRYLRACEKAARLALERWTSNPTVQALVDDLSVQFEVRFSLPLSEWAQYCPEVAPQHKQSLLLGLKGRAQTGEESALALYVAALGEGFESGASPEDSGVWFGKLRQLKGHSEALRAVRTARWGLKTVAFDRLLPLPLQGALAALRLPHPVFQRLSEIEGRWWDLHGVDGANLAAGLAALAYPVSEIVVCASVEAPILPAALAAVSPSKILWEQGGTANALGRQVASYNQLPNEFHSPSDLSSKLREAPDASRVLLLTPQSRLLRDLVEQPALRASSTVLVFGRSAESCCAELEILGFQLVAVGVPGSLPPPSVHLAVPAASETKTILDRYQELVTLFAGKWLARAAPLRALQWQHLKFLKTGYGRAADWAVTRTDRRCEVATLDGERVRLRCRMVQGERYYFSHGGVELNTPPRDAATWTLSHSGEHLLRLSFTAIEGSVQAEVWVIQYRDQDRVAHTAARLANGWNEVAFDVLPEVASIRVAVRLAGTGEVELGQLSAFVAHDAPLRPVSVRDVLPERGDSATRLSV